MKKRLLLVFTCLAALPVFAQYSGDYDAFNYTSGGELIGNGNWIDGGGGSGASAGPKIGSADLSHSGLQTSGGASVSFGAGDENAMLNLSGGGTGTWDGVTPFSVYFSYQLQLSSAANSGPFELTALDQRTTSPIGSRGGEVVVQDNGAGTGFYIGIMKGGQNGLNNAGNRAGIKWIGGDDGSGGVVDGTTTVFGYDTSVLVVGAYNFQGTAKSAQAGFDDDDTADLWINPDASSFGTATAPGGNVTATSSSVSKFDLSNIASLDLIQTDGSGNTAPTGSLDDLRLGTAWADVTPAAVPEPSVVALGAMGLCYLVMLRRKWKEA